MFQQLLSEFFTLDLILSVKMFQLLSLSIRQKFTSITNVSFCHCENAKKLENIPECCIATYGCLQHAQLSLLGSARSFPSISVLQQLFQVPNDPIFYLKLSLVRILDVWCGLKIKLNNNWLFLHTVLVRSQNCETLCDNAEQKKYLNGYQQQTHGAQKHTTLAVRCMSNAWTRWTYSMKPCALRNYGMNIMAAGHT